MIAGRRLSQEEIGQIWAIDRSEIIENVYRFEQGALVLKPEPCEVHGWPPGEAGRFTPLLTDCLVRGGWLFGLFDDARLIGAAVLDGRFIGRSRTQLQLVFLHVSKAYRKQGLGWRLFALAKAEARGRGAKRLYVSATPSENTVDFYRRLGCVMTREPDPELFALEPEDIHLECHL